MAGQDREDERIEAGSPRGFGLLFALVFALVGLWPLWSDGAIRLWALGLGGAFLAAALAAPNMLQPLNRLWHAFGLLLSRIMTPVIMTVLYAVAILPTGLMLRVFGRDPMRRQREPEAPSYWIERRAQPGSMTDQF